MKRYTLGSLVMTAIVAIILAAHPTLSVANPNPQPTHCPAEICDPPEPGACFEKFREPPVRRGKVVEFNRIWSHDPEGTDDLCVTTGMKSWCDNASGKLLCRRYLATGEVREVVVKYRGQKVEADLPCCDGEDTAWYCEPILKKKAKIKKLQCKTTVRPIIIAVPCDNGPTPVPTQTPVRTATPVPTKTHKPPSATETPCPTPTPVPTPVPCTAVNPESFIIEEKVTMEGTASFGEFNLIVPSGTVFAAGVVEFRVYPPSIRNPDGSATAQPAEYFAVLGVDNMSVAKYPLPKPGAYRVEYQQQGPCGFRIDRAVQATD